MDSAANLRRKDTTKGPPCRVLSLDGGGVRGFSMLILLQELMHRTFVEIEGRAPRPEEIPKPCDQFDLIAGSGTGGLIAIMLGRLKLDVRTCMDVYVRMTRKVFETDKTFAGIPYRSTLFKASKLEEAIRECVREHTIYENEGNDGTSPTPTPMTPMAPLSVRNSISSVPSRSMSRASNASGFAPSSLQQSMAAYRWGNPDALLYDIREDRTKTAVTAVFKGTTKNGGSVLLRSYDSRKEPPIEPDCTIWQAGRATSATGLAFKPIQVGQSVFLDEGAGKYNPAPLILDEAAVNEWPGRDIGIFVSIGTGKRPAGSNKADPLWWEGFIAGGMGDFAEARRRLISKIEGCEDTHQYMLREHLSKRGVNPQNYYRLNVEVGVGEFGMNEWNRLADISTSTRRYLAKSEVQRINVDASTKLGRIHRARMRHANFTTANEMDGKGLNRPLPNMPEVEDPMAIELPASEMSMQGQKGPRPVQYQPQNQYGLAPSSEDKFTVVSSDEYPQPVISERPPPPPLPRRSNELQPPGYRKAGDDYSYNQYPPPRSSNGSLLPSPRVSSELPGNERPSPPPLPPKTPLPYPETPNPRMARPSGRPNGAPLPYPDDGPPPIVNKASKPTYGGR